MASLPVPSTCSSPGLHRVLPTSEALWACFGHDTPGGNKNFYWGIVPIESNHLTLLAFPCSFVVGPRLHHDLQYLAAPLMVDGEWARLSGDTSNELKLGPRGPSRHHSHWLPA